MRFRLAICLCLILITTSMNAAAQTDFNHFWKNFKAAVAKKDKNAVAALVQFPLSMPYGVDEVKSKAAFLKSYEFIFNGEADAAKCFPKAAPVKDDAKTYGVYCGFKQAAPEVTETPILYRFELTTTGWKIAGFDNINE